MRTYLLTLTPKQRDEIVKFKKEGGCTILQPLFLDGEKPKLRCCSISKREMTTINRALDKARKRAVPNWEPRQDSKTETTGVVASGEMFGCGEWPTMPLMKRRGGDVNHQWHVAINQTVEWAREAGKEWPRWMYDAMHAAEEVPRLALLLSRERNGNGSDQKQVVDNHLTCCLGVACRECPYLAGLEKSNLPPEQRDWIKAWTCVGHILANGGDRAGGGFLTTVDDRMYWDSVYENLASSQDEQPNDNARRSPHSRQ